MAYLNEDQLHDLGFKSLGRDVKVSDKASIYDAGEIEIGDFSRIDDFCVVSGKVNIGKYCHITPMCLIAGGTKGVVLSDFCTLAYGVKVFSQSDDYSGKSMVNSLIQDCYKYEIKQKTILERQVIVGANTVIMPGVTIQEGCAIGAASLVNKNTDAWGIYVGTPAIRIKDRSKQLLEFEAKFLTEVKDDPI